MNPSFRPHFKPLRRKNATIGTISKGCHCGPRHKGSRQTVVKAISSNRTRHPLFETVGIMSEKFEIPLINGGEPLSVSMQQGQSLFVLGANGSGKSSLLSLFTRNLGAKALRISAHRQMWFDGDVINVSAVERSNVRTSVANWDRDPVSRIRDP